MTASVEDAIAELHAMFSGLDEDTIRMVFESQGHNMENTVECLLSMSGENVEMPPPQPQRQQSYGSRDRERGPVSPTAVHATLPNDFLAFQTAPLENANDQMAVDEMLARDLQEQFEREARLEASRAGREASASAAEPVQQESSFKERLNAIGTELTSFGQVAKSKIKELTDKIQKRPPSSGATYTALGTQQDAEVVAFENGSTGLTRRTNQDHDQELDQLDMHSQHLQDRRATRTTSGGPRGGSFAGGKKDD